MGCFLPCVRKITGNGRLRDGVDHPKQGARSVQFRRTSDLRWHEHKWTTQEDRFKMNDGTTIVFCDVCGVTKRRDGKNKPCSGKTPRLRLWG